MIGADTASRTFQNVSNLADFDPAKIDDLFRKFLHPQPAIQIHELDNGSNGRFILFVIAPSQKRPITISKSTNVDSTAIRVGEMWVKSGTITRLASRGEVDQMYEERMELEAETRARQRFSHFRDELDLATTSRRSDHPINKSLIFGPREALRTFLANALAEQKYAHISILIEMIRDILVTERASKHRGLGGFQWKDQEAKNEYSPRISCPSVEVARASLCCRENHRGICD